LIIATSKVNPKTQPTMSYSMHEVEALRQEVADSRKKLQAYADTGMLSNHQLTSR
jgi:hypothetical protein